MVVQMLFINRCKIWLRFWYLKISDLGIFRDLGLGFGSRDLGFNVWRLEIWHTIFDFRFAHQWCCWLFVKSHSLINATLRLENDCIFKIYQLVTAQSNISNVLPTLGNCLRHCSYAGCLMLVNGCIRITGYHLLCVNIILLLVTFCRALVGNLFSIFLSFCLIYYHISCSQNARSWLSLWLNAYNQGMFTSNLNLQFSICVTCLL